MAEGLLEVGGIESVEDGVLCVDVFYFEFLG